MSDSTVYQQLTVKDLFVLALHQMTWLSAAAVGHEIMACCCFDKGNSASITITVAFDQSVLLFGFLCMAT